MTDALRAEWKIARSRLRRVARVLLPMLLLFELPASVGAAQTVLFHSPADDGVPTSFPLAVPAGATASLFLYLSTGPNPSSVLEEVCVAGDGDEICAARLTLDAEGNLSITGFLPDPAIDAAFVASSTDLRLNLLDAIAPTPGTTRIGEVTLAADTTTDCLAVPCRVQVAELAVVEADLQIAAAQLATPDPTIAVPEPSFAAALGSGMAWLLALHRRRGGARRDSGRARSTQPRRSRRSSSFDGPSARRLPAEAVHRGAARKIRKGLLLHALLLTALLAAPQAEAQRLRTFSNAHDFVGHADPSGGLEPSPPGAEGRFSTNDRMNPADASLRVPRLGREIPGPNLVRPHVTTDSDFPWYTSAPINDGRVTGIDPPGQVWVSDESPYQHFVDTRFHEGPRVVSEIRIWWGPWEPARYKIQVANADGWLEDTTGWLSGSASAPSVHTFSPPIETTRVRVTQDKRGGAGAFFDPPGAPRVDLMSVDEIEIDAVPAPDAAPFAVFTSSSGPGYSESVIADGSDGGGGSRTEPSETWISADTAQQHFVSVELDGLQRVGQVVIEWGEWDSDQFKVQYAVDGIPTLPRQWFDTSSSVGVWLSGNGPNSRSVVSFDPIDTPALRVIQAANGGGGVPDTVVSIAELEVYAAPASSRVYADSTFNGYQPAAAADGTDSLSCVPGDCHFPGMLWVSAETPVEHWLQLELPWSVPPSNIEISWGAWGSTLFHLEAWNGTGWTSFFTGSASSNASIVQTLPFATSRLRIVQPAGAGAGRPGEPVRPDLMSIAEVRVTGWARPATFVSPPMRLENDVASVTLSAIDSGAGLHYDVSSDDGVSWHPVTPGVAEPLPGGAHLRWRARVDGTSSGLVEIDQVTLMATLASNPVRPALWRHGRLGAVTFGIDDRYSTFADFPVAQPGLPLLQAFGFSGSYFVHGNPDETKCLRGGLNGCMPFAMAVGIGHEIANHTVNHGCAASPPDGATNSVAVELPAKQAEILAFAGVESHSLAWPCGTYDLARGSFAAREVLSARGYKDADPKIGAACSATSTANCAFREGEAMELVEEATPRNWMNMKSVATHDFNGITVDLKDAILFAESDGGWAQLVYHSASFPYDGEVEFAATRDVWVDTQREIARYIRWRDRFTSRPLPDVIGRDIRAYLTWSNLGLGDVPLSFRNQYAEQVGAFFAGLGTLIVPIELQLETPKTVLLWGNAIEFDLVSDLGEDYVLFDVPRSIDRAPVRIEITDSPDDDSDGDGVKDIADNCLFEPNPDQNDEGGVGDHDGPNGIGDACECGDNTGDGAVDASDLAALRAWLLDPFNQGLAAPETCSAWGDSECELDDIVVLARRLNVTPLPPGIDGGCEAAIP